MTQVFDVLILDDELEVAEMTSEVLVLYFPRAANPGGLQR